jgi:twinkle protein
MADIRKLTVQRDDFDFASYYRATNPKAKIRNPSYYRQELIDTLSGKTPARGWYLPWGKTHDKLMLRPCEVVVVAGMNGHGKSLGVGQITLALAAQGAKGGVASFEMKPLSQLKRLTRQASKGEMPSEQFADDFLRYLDGKMWFYDHQETLKDADELFGVIKYGKQELGWDYVVIDSLMKCVRSEEKYDQQKEFVDRLCSLARELDILVILVHHLRKGDSEEEIPNKMDLKGSGSVADQADTIIIWWRNKRKERELATGKKDAKDLVQLPDAMAVVEKQRDGEWEGRISLWFHKGAMQFCGDNRAWPMELMTWPK